MSFAEVSILQVPFRQVVATTDMEIQEDSKAERKSAFD